MNKEELSKKVFREFTPGTKFTSLFGRIGEVSIKDEFIIKEDEVLVQDKNGEFLMIFDGKYWAKIDTNPNEQRNKILDEVINIYVPDGNPEIWLHKIQKLKS